MNFDGVNPTGSLLVTNNVIYGTANLGGLHNFGTVFAYNLTTSQLLNLHSFSLPSGSFSANEDGYYPICRLGISGNTVYGAASRGGAGGNGTIFSVGTTGNNFTVIHTFSSEDFINPDGAAAGAPS